MAAPTVYRWDDAEAPIARGEADSMVEILTACLVDGYGVKPAAGWTRDYVNADNTKAAFRNNPATGTGFFLQVDGLNGLAGKYAMLQGFESMTSESDGLLPFHASKSYGWTSSASGILARPWVLIADDRAFYFICWPAQTAEPLLTKNNTSTVFFGDFPTSDPADSFACGLCGSALSYASGYGKMSTPVTPAGIKDKGIVCPRGQDGSLGSMIPTMNPGGGPGHVDYPGSVGAAYVEGSLFLARPSLNNASAYSLRGWMPGFYYPCHTKPFDQLEEVAVLDRTFLSLRHRLGGYNSTTADGNYLISLNDWWS